LKTKLYTWFQIDQLTFHSGGFIALTVSLKLACFYKLYKKKYARWQLHPYPHATPLSNSHHFLACGIRLPT